MLQVLCPVSPISSLRHLAHWHKKHDKMTYILIETCLASITSHNATATSTTHAIFMGCTMWFTGPHNDVPYATWGHATLAPSLSGEPSPTIPCGEFMSEVVKDLPVQSTNTASRSSSAILSEPSTALLTTDSSYVAASPAANASVSHNRTSTSSAYTGPRPTFRASDITGCYAMTGLETTTYITTSEKWITQSGGFYSPYSLPASMACPAFMTLYGPMIPDLLLPSFARSPVCTSYVNWAKNHPSVPKSVYPPGVFNADVYEEWNCAGECVLEVDQMSVLYFATKSYDGCSEISSTTSADPSATSYAVVDGSTL